MTLCGNGMKRMAVVAVLGLTMCLLPARGDEEADAAHRLRQNEALAALAEQFEAREYGPRDYVAFGKEAARLVAKLEAGDRGLPHGLAAASPAAEEHVRNLARTAVDYLGTTDDPGVYAWENTGSPAVMYAAMGFGVILNKWGEHLEPETRDLLVRALRDSAWQDDSTALLVNGRFNVNVGELLGGEAMGYDSELWKRGVKHFNATYELFMARTAHELNAPIYTTYQLVGLLLLQELGHDEIRTRARILLETFLTIHGHLYQPGGGLGAPRSRDYAGGARIGNGSMDELYRLLMGVPEESTNLTFHHVAAVSDYRPPAIIRSFFTDKGDGYTFWTYTAETVARRMPGTAYQLGPERVTVAPWHVVMMPGGEVTMGFSYGHRYQAIHVSMGVIARDDDGRFHSLYQYQPWVQGDRTTSGNGLPSTGSDTNADDFRREGYQYKRMLHGRTMLSLWNPTTTQHKDTRVHLPRWDHLGGELIEADGWFVGRMGSTYIAYRPLGEIEARREEGGRAPHVYLRLPGASGGIFELADVEQFESIDRYAENLRERHLAFDRDALTIEFDALDLATLEPVRIELQYEPESRRIAEEAITMDQIDRGLLDSPWATWDADKRRLTLRREGYETVVYDVPNNAITREPPASEAAASRGRSRR